MSNHVLKLQIQASNGLTTLVQRGSDRLRNEDGEIGSQLILMAILVGAALAALTPIREAISGLVGKITGGVSGTEVT